MNNTTLKQELEKLSDKIFDNADEFISVMFPNVKPDTELCGVYFSAYSCRVEMVLYCGQHIVDGVPMGAVLQWLEDK